jgi:hypothetical protein
MCLLGFDVEDPEPDLVGFAIECREPGSQEFVPLKNRLSFSYDTPARVAVTGDRKYDSTQSPFQKFRWIHFPHEPLRSYVYRGTRCTCPG